MRYLDEHKVNPVNDQIAIKALEDHPSGVPHHYAVILPQGKTLMLDFQNGPINEVGVNGVTQEVFLAIVLDRLRGFQRQTAFACRENALAITKIEEGLMWLHQRTLARWKVIALIGRRLIRNALHVKKRKRKNYEHHVPSRVHR